MIPPGFRTRNPEEASRSSRSSVPWSSVTSCIERTYARICRVIGKRRQRESRKGRETSKRSREGTSERQRGSHDGELVGLAVCCPMTEFIASFSSPVPRNRESSMVERVAKRDSLFHWKLPEKEIEKAACRESCHVAKNNSQDVCDVNGVVKCNFHNIRNYRYTFFFEYSSSSILQLEIALLSCIYSKILQYIVHTLIRALWVL